MEDAHHVYPTHTVDLVSFVTALHRVLPSGCSASIIHWTEGKALGKLRATPLHFVDLVQP